MKDLYQGRLFLGSLEFPGPVLLNLKFLKYFAELNLTPLGGFIFLYTNKTCGLRGSKIKRMDRMLVYTRYNNLKQFTINNSFLEWQPRSVFHSQTKTPTKTTKFSYYLITVLNTKRFVYYIVRNHLILTYRKVIVTSMHRF